MMASAPKFVKTSCQAPHLQKLFRQICICDFKEHLLYKYTIESKVNRFFLFIFMQCQTYPCKSILFHDLKASSGTSPETLELKGRQKKHFGIWNISPRPTSVASVIEISWPTFPISGTLSQTMTFKHCTDPTWQFVYFKSSTTFWCLASTARQVQKLWKAESWR